MSSKTAEGLIVKVIYELTGSRKVPSNSTVVQFSNDEIWDATLKELDGQADFNNSSRMHAGEYDDFTKRRLAEILQSRLAAKKSLLVRGKRGYTFRRDKLVSQAIHYGYSQTTVATDASVLPINKVGTVSSNSPFASTENIVQISSSCSRNVASGESVANQTEEVEGLLKKRWEANHIIFMGPVSERLKETQGRALVGA
jgi:hypothetical protein